MRDGEFVAGSLVDQSSQGESEHITKRVHRTKGLIVDAELYHLRKGII